MLLFIQSWQAIAGSRSQISYGWFEKPLLTDQFPLKPDFWELLTTEEPLRVASNLHFAYLHYFSVGLLQTDLKCHKYYHYTMMKSGHELISISTFKLIQEIESISRSPKTWMIFVGKIVTLFTFFEREIQNVRKHSIRAGI